MQTTTTYVASLVLAVALAVGVPATAGARTPARGHSCYPARSTTLAATASVRVFQTRAASRDTRVRATYGCLLSRNRPLRFEVPDFPTGYDHIAIAGRFVAYAVYSDCAASFCDPNSVVVQDLGNGAQTFVDGPLRVASVSSLVLRATGSVAWIQSTFDENGSTQPGFAVVKADHGQPPVVLDSGPGVAPGSLALAAATLYWITGGLPATAALG